MQRRWPAMFPLAQIIESQSQPFPHAAKPLKVSGLEPTDTTIDGPFCAYQFGIPLPILLFFALDTAAIALGSVLTVDDAELIHQDFLASPRLLKRGSIDDLEQRCNEELIGEDRKLLDEVTQLII